MISGLFIYLYLFIIITKLFIVVILSFFTFSLTFLFYISFLIPILMSIVFFTVFERKVLAASQRRKGPNIVGMYGLLQAFADGLKLINKETIIPIPSNFIIFLFSSILIFILALFGFILIPISEMIVHLDVSLGVLFFFVISSLGVYSIFMSGWSSNSKYPILGALRSSAQIISYEVCIGLVTTPLFIYSGSLNLTEII